jgi:hypothetical protein
LYSPRKAFPVGIQSVHLFIDGIKGIVVAPLPVFGFVINGGTLDLHLTGGKIALKVGVVLQGIPEAPFHKGEKGERPLNLHFCW